MSRVRLRGRVSRLRVLIVHRQIGVGGNGVGWGVWFGRLGG